MIQNNIFSIVLCNPKFRRHSKKKKCICQLTFSFIYEKHHVTLWNWSSMANEICRKRKRAIWTCHGQCHLAPKTLALKPRCLECVFVAFESSTPTCSHHSHHHCSSLPTNVVILNPLLHNPHKLNVSDHQIAVKELPRIWARAGTARCESYSVSHYWGPRVGKFGKHFVNLCRRIWIELFKKVLD